jgi:hypothetical protein
LILRYSPAVTTPPAPAGWYPDPDGSGAQRYWDGSAWTQHLSPDAPPTPEPSEPPAAAEFPVSEQPTLVVPTRPASSEERVGAHRAPEPESEFEPEPSAQPTAPVSQLTPPPGQPGPPPTIESTYGQPTPGDNRKLIVWFSAACAALLAVLVLVVVYAMFLHDPDTVEVATPTTTPVETTIEEPTAETSAPGWGDVSPTTETETPAGSEAADGPLLFTVTGVETGTVISSTDAPIEKTAQGEYILVRISVINTSDAPAQFLGTLQKLHAGGTTYNIDDEATFYIGGGFVEIPPGGEAIVGVAYDVPPGTVAESIELHVDPLSPGVQLPL